MPGKAKKGKRWALDFGTENAAEDSCPPGYSSSNVSAVSYLYEKVMETIYN